MSIIIGPQGMLNVDTLTVFKFCYLVAMGEFALFSYDDENLSAFYITLLPLMILSALPLCPWRLVLPAKLHAWSDVHVLIDKYVPFHSMPNQLMEKKGVRKSMKKVVRYMLSIMSTNSLNSSKHRRGACPHNLP